MDVMDAVWPAAPAAAQPDQYTDDIDTEQHAIELSCARTHTHTQHKTQQLLVTTGSDKQFTRLHIFKRGYM